MKNLPIKLKQGLHSKASCLLVTILLVSITALTSCTSSQAVQTEQTPDISVPFPDPIVDGESVVVLGTSKITDDGVSLTTSSQLEEGPVAVMPLWYWTEIVRYVINVNTVE